MIKRDKRTILLSLFGTAALVAITGASIFLKSEKNRGPASTDAALLQIQKREILRGPGGGYRIPVSGKSNGMMAIAITAPGKGAVGRGTVIDLKADIEARSDLQGLKYLWILPKDGVRLVSGAMEGDLGSLASGQLASVEISVISDTDENRRVHLHVYKVVDGENMGQMAQYNTVNQEAIEWVAKDKAEKIRAAAEESGRTHNKIYQ